MLSWGKSMGLRISTVLGPIPSTFFAIFWVAGSEIMQVLPRRNIHTIIYWFIYSMYDKDFFYSTMKGVDEIYSEYTI